MSFATQKYFQKYNISSGINRQQQFYLSSDDSDFLRSSSPPISTQLHVPHTPQAKILDSSLESNR
jgi:hypothetical protein